MPQRDQPAARLMLIALIALVPVIGATGIRHGYDLPRLTLMGIGAALLLPLAVVAIPERWRSLPASGRTALTAAAGFLAWATLAASTSGAPALSILGPDGRFVGLAALLAAGILLGAVPAALITHHHLDVALRALAIGLAGVAVISLIQTAGFAFLRPDAMFAGRPIATLGNPNFVGAVAALGVPLAGYFWLAPVSRRRWLSRLLAVGLGALALATVAAAQALLGWVAAVAGMVVFAVLALPANRWRRLVGWAVATVPLGTPLVGLGVVAIGGAGGYQTAAARLGYWSTIVPMWLAHPVAGVGPGRIGAHYREQRPVSAALEFGTDGAGDSAHAYLLDIAATTGTVGLLLLGTVLGAVGLVLRQAWLDAADEPSRRWRVAAVAGLLAAHGMQSSISVPIGATVWLGWLLLGLALALTTASPRRRRPPHRSRRRRTDTAGIVAGAAAALLAVLVVVPAVQVLRTADDVGVAGALLQAGEIPAATAIADRAVERTPWWPTVWFTRTEIAATVGDTDTARQTLEGVLDADERNVLAHRWRADVERADGDEDAAASWYRRASELDPHGVELHQEIAEFALDNGRLDLAEDAIAVLEQVGPEQRRWERVIELRQELGEQRASG